MFSLSIIYEYLCSERWVCKVMLPSSYSILFFNCSCCCVKMINKRSNKNIFFTYFRFRMETNKKLDFLSFERITSTRCVCIFPYFSIQVIYHSIWEKNELIEIKEKFFFCSVRFFCSIHISHFIAFNRTLLLLMVKNWKITWIFELEMSLRYC